MIKKEVIPNYYSYILKNNGIELTNPQKRHFFNCVNKIHRENSRVIYRGDKKDRININDYTNRETGQINPIFLFGAKGRMFFGDEPSGPNELDIMGATGNEFDMIFQMLGNLLSREQPFPIQIRAMARFENSEVEVTRFFRNDLNKNHFIDTLSRLDNKQRLFIRDYYLALLHHISTSDYYPSSFLLSATSSFNMARKFAFGNNNIHQNTSAILVGWIPKNYMGLLSLPNANFLRRRVDMTKLGLPVYKRSFFPEQYEITLKGGLLPHYLLGVLHYDNEIEVFEINPAVFDTNENWDGKELPVDQSTFVDRIRETQFGRYFSLEDGGFHFNQHWV